MKILIIRHGDPDYSIDSLTKKGWKEAEILSERLKKIHIDDFYCSPLGRAKDTASKTLEKVNKEAEILPWLAEFRGRITSLETTKERHCWDLPPDYWTNVDGFYDNFSWFQNDVLRNTNVENIFKETQIGVDELLKKYGYINHGRIYKCQKENDKTIAIFCHFALGMAIISCLTKVSPMILWHNFFMPTSSVTTVVTQNGQDESVIFRCMQVGDTSHLYKANEGISESGLYPKFENWK